MRLERRRCHLLLAAMPASNSPDAVRRPPAGMGGLALSEHPLRKLLHRLCKGAPLPDAPATSLGRAAASGRASKLAQVLDRHDVAPMWGAAIQNRESADGQGVQCQTREHFSVNAFAHFPEGPIAKTRTRP